MPALPRPRRQMAFRSRGVIVLSYNNLVLRGRRGQRPRLTSAVKSTRSEPRTRRVPRRLWDTAGRQMTARGMAIRSVLAAAVLVPAAALTCMLGQPFAISAIASTSAIVLHAPQQYHQRPQRILACYIAGIGISAPISLVGAAVGLPVLLAAAVAAVIIVATPPGRVHPPTACIPLAITPQAIQPLALLGRWLSFSGLAAACLAIMWLLTVQPQSRIRRGTIDHPERPCTAGT